MNRSVPIDGRDASAARQRLWLAALHQLAIADGDFSTAEQTLLAEELARELPGLSLEDLHHPGAEALAHRFVPGSALAEEFLRTALLVALADGEISPIERQWLRHWGEALRVGGEVIDDLHPDREQHPGALDRLRRWLDQLEPSDSAVARFLVRLIPAQCPFARDLTLFGWKVVHIPPLCKINPLYDQLVALRFRSLCRLEDLEAPPQVG